MRNNVFHKQDNKNPNPNAWFPECCLFLNPWLQFHAAGIDRNTLIKLMKNKKKTIFAKFLRTEIMNNDEIAAAADAEKESIDFGSEAHNILYQFLSSPIVFFYWKNI